MGDAAHRQDFTMINNKQIKPALVIGKSRLSGEE